MQDKINITSEEIGIRLDKFLSAHLDNLSRTQVQELIIAGQVECDGKVINNPALKTKLVTYEVNVGYIKAKPTHLMPYDFPLDIDFICWFVLSV